MLYNLKRKLCRHLLVGGALCVTGLGMYSCSDNYELDDVQPEGLNSIYGYMSESGNFTNYLRLIDDLGQAEILSKTGSKTMFIAADTAFEKFYASNSWGVKKYEDLSPTQKKLLLYSSMIDNPYSSSMLSSASSNGASSRPTKGEVCRRSSSLTLYDSVSVIPTNDSIILPANSRFDEIRKGRDSIVLFTDASTAAPMIHFTGKFIAQNQMSNTDVDFLYNQAPGTYTSDDVYVNNAKVVENNIFCKNGFIHVVDKVILPLDNMAEIIRKNKKMSTFSKILERFAAPDVSNQLTDAYNQVNGKNVDTVFIKRYFSDRTAGSGLTADSKVSFLADKNGVPFDANAKLKFDPGWNGYVPEIANDRVPMMEDMAVMLVPTNEAMEKWWREDAKDIKDFYHSLDETPSSVLSELIKVNQIASFTGTVPSKFKDVLDDAGEDMGLSADSVESVFLGCNGMVYMTSKVYAPKSYSSVYFPAIVDTTSFSVIRNAIETMNYDVYLNSMASKYTFLIPTNKGLLSYIDPVSYGQTTPKLWEFYLDNSKEKENERLCADVYDCILNDDGTWVKDDSKKPTKVTGGTANGVIYDRMEDLLDNIIVTSEYESGKKYYLTKGRTHVKIETAPSGDIYVSGSWQDERNQPLKVVKVYPKHNGKTLVLDGPVMGTRNSVIKTLSKNPDFSEFRDMLLACGAVMTSNDMDNWQAGDQEFGNLLNKKNKGALGNEDGKSQKGKFTYLLNNFHYTLYAPTNDAMQKAYELGLPSLEDLEAAELLDAELGFEGSDTANAAKIREVMLDFVKYHIQDNSIYVDEGFESGDYESAKTELIKSTNVDELTGATSWSGKYSPGRPYRLNVNVSSKGMTVEDCRNGYDPVTRKSLGGHKANVILEDGYYNLMAREYWYASSGKVTNPQGVQINNSSAVVIQGIDAPLIFSDGNHYDQTGMLSQTQFKYVYKQITTEAKKRK